MDMEPQQQDQEPQSQRAQTPDLLNFAGCSSLDEMMALIRERFASTEEVIEYFQRTGDQRIIQILMEHSERAQSRKKLPDVNTLDDVCSMLRNKKKILVLTGAGISVSAGIPDFRSENGIYQNLVRRGFDIPRPECMFDIKYFKGNPHPFYSFAHELWPGNHNPTPSHRFIALLENHGCLLRNYTQNIDTLEQRAGITRVINCHGSFASATCVTCGRKEEDGVSALEADVQNQRVARCPDCTEREARGEVDMEQQEEPASYGVMKPDIVFFGEALPASYFDKMKEDIEQVDMVIVMGTSLKVAPVCKVIGMVGDDVPAILINREVVGQPHRFDVELLGDCDSVCGELCKRLGWDLGVHPGAAAASEVVEVADVEGDEDADDVREIALHREAARKAVDEGKIVRHGQSRYLFSGYRLPEFSPERSPLEMMRADDSSDEEIMDDD